MSRPLVPVAIGLSLLLSACSSPSVDTKSDPGATSPLVSINQDPVPSDQYVRLDFWATASLSDFECEQRTLYQIDDEPVYIEFAEGWAKVDTVNMSDDSFSLAPGYYGIKLLGRTLVWPNGQPATGFTVSPNDSLRWFQFYTIDTEASCDPNANDDGPDDSPDGGVNASPDGGLNGD